MVDPYDWLGLPEAHRPPTHYQLLGIPAETVDAAAVRAAADRQFRRLLPHLTGPERPRSGTGLVRTRRRPRHAARSRPAVALRRSDTWRRKSPADETASQPAATSIETEPLSPEELASATLPDPNPWWKGAAEAPVMAGPWWKEATPEPLAPPPVQTSPVWKSASLSQPAAAVATMPRPLQAPRPQPSSHLPLPMPDLSRDKPRKSTLMPVLLGGIVVSGLIAGGVYFAVTYKSKSPPTVPGPVAESTKPASIPHKRLDPEPPPPEDPLPEIPLPKDFSNQLRPRSFKGHAGAVNWLGIAKSGSRFASAGTDRTLKLWSVTKDDSVQRHTFISPAIGVAWCDQDRKLVAADGFTVAIFDTKNSSGPRTLDSPRGGVSALAVTADGGHALTGLSDGYLRMWDTNSGRADEWAVAARGPVTAVDISPNGVLAVASVQDGPVSLWNLASRARVLEWSPHPGGAIALRFSPDGTRVASAGAEGIAAVYDITGKKEVCRIEAQSGPVTGVAWLPDGGQFVTVGVDGKARLWSAESGQALRWSQQLDGKGNCVAVDPGGRYILAGTSTGVIHLFPLPRVKPETVAGKLGKPPAEPLPVPSSEAVAAAVSSLRTELAREFSYNRPDDMALLADNLRRRAGLERVPPPLRYGLLQNARTLATQAGDPVTAFAAIDDLGAWFDIDELREKAATFAALPDDADPTSMFRVGVATAERAETDARSEIVGKLLQKLPERRRRREPPPSVLLVSPR